MTAEDPRLDVAVDIDGALVLEGEIDSYTSPELTARLNADPTIEIVDLAAVTFIDSSGLRALVQAHQARNEVGSSLQLRAPSAAVQRLLEISGLAGYLDVSS